MRPLRLSLLLASLLLGTVSAPAALASPGSPFLLGVSDARIGLDGDGRVRAGGREVAAAAGASVVRLPVVWADVTSTVPPGATKHAPSLTRPPGDLSDPANPGYDFTPLDQAVRELSHAGFAPLLYVRKAPVWAEAPGRWRFAADGTWAPDPAALGVFAQALARRYDGSFPDPLAPGSTLPRVTRFQSWNEPNLPNYLQPQWVVRGGRWVPFAPHWYRRMHNAFIAGVHQADPGALVASAGTAPVGESRDGLGRMAPLRFWHAFACLQPPPSLAPVRCANPAHLDAIALHPLSVTDPDRRADQRLDFAIADIAKVTRVVDAARRLGRVVAPVRPRLWITELNWESGPPPGVPPAAQADYVSRGLHRLWAAGAELVLWHFVTDPVELLDGRQRPAGLTHVGPGGIPGAPKPFLRAFALPLTADRMGPDRVRVWLVAPRGSASPVLERRTAAGWAPLRQLAAGSGPVEVTVRVRGGAVLRAVAGARTSASVRVVAG